jgi:hypothetical protein
MQPGRLRRHEFERIENNSALSTFARDRLNKSTFVPTEDPTRQSLPNFKQSKLMS